MSINSISKAVSQKIASELSLPKERQEVLQYGMILLLSQLMTFILLAAEAYVLNMVKEFLILAACGAVLRRYSGGAHCSSPLRCSLLSLITIPLLVLVARFICTLNSWINISIVVIVNMISMGIIYKYAPKDSPAKPIKNIEKIKRLKLRSLFISSVVTVGSLVLLFFSYGHVSILMTLGTINQAISLTKPGSKYIHTFDRILRKLHI